MRGIIHNSGTVWQEQRRFALRALRDFGFGKKGVDGIIQEEAELLIRTLLEDSSASPDGGTIPISAQKLNVPVVNVLWQIVASKRFDPHAQETREMLDIVFMRFTKSFSITLLFPFLKRYLPESPSDKGVKQMKAFMRKQIEEHQASYDEDAPARDFIDVYLAEIK